MAGLVKPANLGLAGMWNVNGFYLTTQGYVGGNWYRRKKKEEFAEKFGQYLCYGFSGSREWWSSAEVAPCRTSLVLSIDTSMQ